MEHPTRRPARGRMHISDKNQRRSYTMSYVDEIYERVVAQNPGEPEFHQAVKEVLDSLRLVIDANEEKYHLQHRPYRQT